MRNVARDQNRIENDLAFANLETKLPGAGNREQVYLLPGQLHVSAVPCQIKTILGSCVSICLWDKRRSTGGMNHFLLPCCAEGQRTSLRYGDEAIRELIERMLALGCRQPNLRAKIFGGGAILTNRDCYARSLGAQNVAFALSLMKRARIPVIAQETGGPAGRKVIFNTDDGMAWSQRV